MKNHKSSNLRFSVPPEETTNDPMRGLVELKAQVPVPMVILPSIELEGAIGFAQGRLIARPGAVWGFAFCPYNFGTSEHDNWIFGYSCQAIASPSSDYEVC